MTFVMEEGILAVLGGGGVVFGVLACCWQRFCHKEPKRKRTQKKQTQKKRAKKKRTQKSETDEEGDSEGHSGSGSGSGSEGEGDEEAPLQPSARKKPRKKTDKRESTRSPPQHESRGAGPDDEQPNSGDHSRREDEESRRSDSRLDLSLELEDMKKELQEKEVKTAELVAKKDAKEAELAKLRLRGEVPRLVKQIEAQVREVREMHSEILRQREEQKQQKKQIQIRQMEKQRSDKPKTAPTNPGENRLDSSQEVSDDQMGRTDSSPRRGNTADKTSVLLSKRVESGRQKPAEPGKLKSSKATKEPAPTPRRTTGFNRRATSTRTRVQEQEPEPEPGCEEDSVVVEGAGTDSFNGIYKPSGKLRGKTKYCRTGGGETLEWEGGHWKLIKLNNMAPNNSAHYVHDSPPGVTPAQDQPPSDGWTVMPMSAGKEPSPTVRVASGADLAV